ncbi:MAG: Sapep family Mn(2+)-dependent dipeptidase [Bacteroides sp.]|nr:Sapep family Mn(2+)-dependent dipeptidase [Bacteroides sp.]
MEIKDYLKNSLPSMKNDLARLVRIPSVSGEREGKYPFGAQCGRVLEEFLKICEENGFKGVNYDYFAGSADQLEGKAPELGILAHLDVVPVTEKDWSFPPYEVTEKDGRLYGRGCMDDKGAVIASLYAMKAVKDCGYSLKRNVRLIVGCSEETGSELDIAEYMKRAEMPRAVFTPDAEFPVITTEKGMLRFTFGGDIDCGLIESIEGGTVVNAVPAEVKAVLNGELSLRDDENISCSLENGKTTILCKGRSAHASTPEQGINAFTRLFEYLSELELPEADRAMLTSLLSLFPKGETNAASMGLDITDASGSTTCVFSIMDYRGGKLTCKADMRFPVSLTKAAAEEKIKAAVVKNGLKFISVTGSEPHSVDPDSDFVKTLLKVYTEVTGKEGFCKAIGGGTYVHGIEGGVAFGMETENVDNHIHGADEWISIDTLLTSAEIYANAVIKYCG